MSSPLIVRERERPSGAPPVSQTQLPERTVQDSLVSATVPLGSDGGIRDLYRSFLGTVRVGRLMEDMDLFSVWTCRAFLLYPPGYFPLIVTAYVDEFELTPFLPQPDQDIRLRGRVTWTGKTTLEAEVRMEQLKGEDWRVLTKAFFVLAARTLHNEPMEVNRLRPTTPAEEKIVAAGNQRRQRRFELADDRSLLQAPTSEEYAMLHSNYLATLAGGDLSAACLPETPRRAGCERLSESRLTTTVFAHPIDRNMYNTVFGGYIMRMAQELSSANTYLLW
ncbi:acyl-coenzyme A thioesterase 9, mitochondrial-like [Schistocerca cancellata]|uniref:acyl-coenzyme A thioesterase 9, mitochondrial-like n=1 Tax=Schistocerca cancellata TaxID=274614 RepID=UPI0021192BBC|nr:acyl-coenzyme A thioesterase 9, mitochondrial-like [Schistocerca cancellata]